MAMRPASSPYSALRSYRRFRRCAPELIAGFGGDDVAIARCDDDRSAIAENSDSGRSYCCGPDRQNWRYAITPRHFGRARPLRFFYIPSPELAVLTIINR